MSDRRELKGTDDIKILVDTFYTKVLQDKDLNHIFTDIAKLDFDAHMPTMYSFWESMLFGAASYKGNPMLAHIKLNQKIKLNEIHFDRWRTLFFTCLDEGFYGEKVTEAKQRVDNMIALMKFKLAASQEKGFIQ